MNKGVVFLVYVENDEVIPIERVIVNGSITLAEFLDFSGMTFESINDFLGFAADPDCFHLVYEG